MDIDYHKNGILSKLEISGADEDNEGMDNWNTILHISVYLWFYKSCKQVTRQTRFSSYYSFQSHFPHHWKSWQAMKGEHKKQGEKYFYSLKNDLDNWAVTDTIHSKKKITQRKNKQRLKNELNI